MKETNGCIDRLLNPKTVAVIGASDQAGKAGNLVVKQFLGGDFRLFPVNPKGGTVCGLPAYCSVVDVPEAPDLAVIVLPAEITPAATHECVKRGVGTVVVVPGGFGEVGDDGKALEKQLETAIAGSHTRLLGPNTLGLLVPRHALDTIFLPPGRPRRPGPGSVAIISQSGSAIMGAMDIGAFYGAGLSAFVGLGNRLDIDENELLKYFLNDPSTAAIGLYLESFADPQGFVEVCRELVPRKPLVLLRAGRSSAGARAVQLHTGSLAGSDRATDGVLRQLGVVRVYDTDQLMDNARALAFGRPLAGRRIAVLTAGGGTGIITADYIEAKHNGISSSLATLLPETESRLKKIALPFASVRNPIDLTASVNNEMFDAALGILQDDPGVDVILCCYDYNPPGLDDRLTEILRHWAKEGVKPLIAATLGSEAAIQGLQELEAAGVPAFPSIWRAVQAIDVLASRGEFFSREKLRTLHTSVDAGQPGPESVELEFGTPLAEDQLKAILRQLGIATPRSVVLPKGELPAKLGLPYPLVVKVRSASILHKTELKGVVLNIRSRRKLEQVVKEMASRFPGEDLLVEQMEAQGVEMIVGLVDDPTFGLCIMCGVGGVLAELYQDVSFRRVPIDNVEADQMLRELKAHALFEGFRGKKVNRDAAVELLVRISRLGQDLAGQIDQLDLNPVIVREDKAVAVDAKLLWKIPSGEKTRLHPAD